MISISNLVGVVEALSNVSYGVRQLLDLAKAWSDDSSADLPASPRYKTARQLRPAEVDELVAAYQAGATTKELGARFGLWRGTVGRHLKARGIDTRAPKLGSNGIQKAARLYQAGWTLDKLANRYGVGYNTIRVQLIKAGVVMRPRGRRTKDCES